MDLGLLGQLTGVLENSLLELSKVNGAITTDINFIPVGLQLLFRYIVGLVGAILQYTIHLGQEISRLVEAQQTVIVQVSSCKPLLDKLSALDTFQTYYIQ